MRQLSPLVPFNSLTRLSLVCETIDHGTFPELLLYSLCLVEISIIYVIFLAPFPSHEEPVRSPSVKVVSGNCTQMLNLGHQESVMPSLFVHFPNVVKWQPFWSWSDDNLLTGRARIRRLQHIIATLCPLLKNVDIEVDTQSVRTISQLNNMIATAFPKDLEDIKLFHCHSPCESMTGLLAHSNIFMSIELWRRLDEDPLAPIAPFDILFFRIVEFCPHLHMLSMRHARSTNIEAFKEMMREVRKEKWKGNEEDDGSDDLDEKKKLASGVVQVDDKSSGGMVIKKLLGLRRLKTV
ncbi:hypothetical protein BGW39_000293 [Mortierella sp. 14UC]|nr:hypothetical protein BGW39_000293 [Mortierella sp. 14UC]